MVFSYKMMLSKSLIIIEMTQNANYLRSFQPSAFFLEKNEALK